MAVTSKRYTLAHLCSKVGCTRGELEHALKIGAIPDVAITTTPRGHRKITNFPLAVEAMQLHKGERTAPPVGDQTFDLAQGRARKEHFAGLREELRYRKEAGELIEVDTTTRTVVSQFRALMERVLEVVPRFESELAAIDDPHTLGVTLRAALIDAGEETRIRVGKVQLLDGTNDCPR